MKKALLVSSVFVLFVVGLLMTIYFGGIFRGDTLAGTNWVYYVTSSYNENTYTHGLSFSEDGFMYIWKNINGFLTSSEGIEYSVGGRMLTLHNFDPANGIENVEYSFRAGRNSLLLEYEGETVEYTRMSMTREEYYEKYVTQKPGG